MPGKHTQARDTRDARYDFLMSGTVVDNVDPQKHGRVRVLIPGLLEPKSRLCFPIGRMFGVKAGIHFVPEVGSNVVVFLNQGDVDHPYYLAGPPGAPGGVSDQGDHYPQGSVDHVSIRWRGFHLTIDGTSGAEKLTVEDLGSGTKIQIDKTTGDYLRDVEGSEVVRVLTNRSVTVEQGDETHTVTVGKRTTSIQGDDAKTIVAGGEIKTITAGNKTLTMPVGSEVKTLTLGGSTETMPLGIKTVTALTLLLNALAAATLSAVGAVTVQGNGVNVTSTGTGVTNNTSGGLVTNNFLGGVIETVTGAFAKTISGVATFTFNGIANLVGATINLGLGTGGFKAALNRDVIAAINAHTHGGVMAGAGTTGTPTTPITPGGATPFNENDMVATNVNVS